jgi:hypothetical protein
MNDEIMVSRHTYGNGVQVLVIEHTRDDPRHPSSQSKITTCLYVPLHLVEKLISDLQDKGEIDPKYVPDPRYS